MEVLRPRFPLAFAVAVEAAELLPLLPFASFRLLSDLAAAAAAKADSMIARWRMMRKVPTIALIEPRSRCCTMTVSSMPSVSSCRKVCRSSSERILVVVAGVEGCVTEEEEGGGGDFSLSVGEDRRFEVVVMVMGTEPDVGSTRLKRFDRVFVDPFVVTTPEKSYSAVENSLSVFRRSAAASRRLRSSRP